MRQSLLCFLGVAHACGIRYPVLVPGHIGEKAARRQFRLQAEQVIEVGNEWGFILDHIHVCHPSGLLVLGHPGKLVKLACGSFDTHSSRSGSALPFVLDMARSMLGREFQDIPTVEGIFSVLENSEKERLGAALAGAVQTAVAKRLNTQAHACGDAHRGRTAPDYFPLLVAVMLIDMKGNRLGSKGDLSEIEKI